MFCMKSGLYWQVVILYWLLLTQTCVIGYNATHVLVIKTDTSIWERVNNLFSMRNLQWNLSRKTTSRKTTVPGYTAFPLVKISFGYCKTRKDRLPFRPWVQGRVVFVDRWYFSGVHLFGDLQRHFVGCFPLQHAGCEEECNQRACHTMVCSL